MYKPYYRKDDKIVGLDLTGDFRWRTVVNKWEEIYIKQI